MIVMNNLSAENARRNLKVISRKYAKTTNRLSSGYRINSAADDAAGLSISEKMRGQIRGLNQASNNIQDGVSFAQVADGAMEEMHGMVKRMRELSVQAANDTNNIEDRESIQDEIDQLVSEYGRIIKDTEFNTIPVFEENEVRIKEEEIEATGPLQESGSLEEILGMFGFSGNYRLDLDMTLGADWLTSGKDDYADTYEYAGEKGIPGKTYGSVWLDFSGFGKSYNQYDLDQTGCSSVCATCKKHYSIIFSNGGGDLYQDSYTDPLLQIDISSVRNGTQMVERIMDALNAAEQFVNHFTQYAVDPNQPDRLNIYDNRTDYNEGNGDPGGDSDFGLKPRDTSGDVIDKPDNVVSSPEDRTAYTHLWLQTGANEGQGFYLEKPIMTVETLGIDQIDVLSHESAGEAITICDEADRIISEKRAMMGAYVNRLETSKLIVDSSSENLQGAESKIRDADMAKEMLEYSKESILQQSGTSILAQANRQADWVINLLQ